MVWFRSDLRVRDNTALHHACGESPGGVLGVFVICPGQWREHDWADVKVAFILETLRELSEKLRALRVPLLIVTADRFRDVPGRLLDLARAHECTALLFNREYEVNETRRDEAVTRVFEDAGLRVVATHDQCVVAPGVLRTTTDGYYTVFTPFRKTWLRFLDDKGVPDLLGEPAPQPRLDVQPDEVPESIEGFDATRPSPESWPAGEDAATRRLETFIANRLREYDRDRDHPGLEGTSALSPYLTVGAISPRQCVLAAMRANGNRLDGNASGPATWISEVIWREFYRHFLVGFPRVSMGLPFRLQTDALPWRHDETQFAAWCGGRTGVPIVDAGMRQLAQTGWMHNRLRMITAMFLTKDLFIDWRWGERHFMRHLIDGDLASNNGGWQWSASTGADAVPYFRIFNPYRQASRFDKDGAFIRRYVPELADVPAAALHDPARLASQVPAERYPRPIVDHAEAAARAVAAFRDQSAR